VSAESERVAGFGHLEDGLRQAGEWYQRGPYVSERQWSTVREDYSPGGEAWDYLPRDHARSRAYRWGEDGLAGFCDIEQRLCLAGRRPCFGGVSRLQDDPAWRDNLLFSEYFHGDNGAGLGASHQTGWTGLIADVIRRRHGAIPTTAELLAGLGTAAPDG
jgi:hypothetical protein